MFLVCNDFLSVNKYLSVCLSVCVVTITDVTDWHIFHFSDWLCVIELWPHLSKFHRKNGKCVCVWHCFHTLIVHLITLTVHASGATCGQNDSNCDHGRHSDIKIIQSVIETTKIVVSWYYHLVSSDYICSMFGCTSLNKLNCWKVCCCISGHYVLFLCFRLEKI